MKKLAVVLGLILPAMVLGAAASSWDPIAQFRPVVAVKGFFVGPTKGKNSVVQDVNNGFTAIRVTPITYDFPSLAAPAPGIQGYEWNSSALHLDAGLLPNDKCDVVGLAMYDGGLIPAIKLSCYVPAYNTVVITAQNTSSDAGAFNPSNSIYEIWTTSHLTQPAQ